MIARRLCVLFTAQALALGFLGSGSLRWSPPPHAPPSPDGSVRWADLRERGVDVGSPLRVRNLDLYPLMFRDAAAMAAPAAAGRDLDLADERIHIRESPSGGEVGRIVVENRSSDPVFLRLGDIVAGGLQDRLVARSVLIPSSAREFSVPVVCVESGRWGPGAGATVAATPPIFRRAPVLADPGVLRFAACGDQGGVWDEVRRKRTAFEALEIAGGDAPRPSSYPALADEPGVEAGAADYVTALVRGIESSGERPAGFAVAICGRLVLAEVFESPSAARARREAVLRAYALEALARDATAGPAPTAASVRALLGEGLRGRIVECSPAGLAETRRLAAASMEGVACVAADDRVLHVAMFAMP